MKIKVRYTIGDHGHIICIPGENNIVLIMVLLKNKVSQLLVLRNGTLNLLNKFK